MAWLCVDKDGQEVLFTSVPVRNVEEGCWVCKDGTNRVVEIRKGAIEQLTGKRITWEDEPIQI